MQSRRLVQLQQAPATSMRKQVFVWRAVGAGAAQIVQSIAYFKAFRKRLTNSNLEKEKCV